MAMKIIVSYFCICSVFTSIFILVRHSFFSSDLNHISGTDYNRFPMQKTKKSLFVHNTKCNKEMSLRQRQTQIFNKIGKNILQHTLYSITIK